MRIQKIQSLLLRSNMYIVYQNQHALLIDPCICPLTLDHIQVDYILLTHEHYDHISGVNFWKDKTGAPVLCSEACAKGCGNPQINLSHFFSIFCELQTWVELERIPAYSDYTCEADATFTDDHRFVWHGSEVRMFESPGHSAGGICILIDERILFSGDSLIKDHPISCVLPGGSRKQWLNQSLPKLKRLKPDTMVYPGHFDDCLLTECNYGEV